MNQNKRACGAYALTFFFVIVMLLWRVVPVTPDCYGSGMSSDAVRIYARCIESEMVTNWHSSLFMYECIGLKRVIDLVFGRLLTGVEILYMMWILTTLMASFAICTLAHILPMRRYWRYVVFPVCVALSFKYVRHLSPIGLDYYYTCVLWCCLAAMVIYGDMKKSRFQTVALVLIFVFLLHLVAYRRNSVLCIPFIVGWAVYMADWLRKLQVWKKITIWATGTLMCIAFSLTWVDMLFPVAARHPVIPMMESDVRIASILRGEQDVVRKNGLLPVTGNLEESCISAYWLGVSEDRWNEFLNLYLDEWKHHPDTMCAACIIQRVQFYSGGHNFSFLKRFIESKFPAVRGNVNAWKTLVPTVSFPLKRLFCLFISPICVLFGGWGMRRNVIDAPICSIVIISGSLAILYASSYLIVVPTSDARYLAPAHMMSIFSLSVLSFAILETSGKWIYAKLHLR